MDAKKVIKELLPPAFLRLIRNLRNGKNGFGFEGEFSSWDAAAAACQTAGYAEPNILQKTLKSVLAVKNGQAVFERDSVLFSEIQYSWPLLSSILLVAANTHNNLRILDFGGSLGSTYFQNKKFLDGIPHKISYGVVEQSHYVDVGNEQISDENLSFYKNITDYIADIGKPHLLILNGVLQYLENYSDLLKDILSKDIEFIVIDRTPFVAGGGERIMIQNVPETIYAARYPHRLFQKSEFLANFTNHGYEVLEGFKAIDNGNEFATWEGFIFAKTKSN